MEREARLLAHNPDTGVEIWCDEEVWPEIQSFFFVGIASDDLGKEARQRQNRLRHVMQVIMLRATHRDILEFECVDQSSCAWIVKMFQGSQNTRIVCWRSQDPPRDCLVFAKLIEKKKSQKLDASAKQLIKTVAGYEYHLPRILR